MSKKITGAEFPIMKIFSSDFDYHIPSYQRPYAWTEEEAGILFDDLYDFYQTEPDDNYFLGSIVLIKEENIPEAKVIDGQQRLTTLTILLAVLTSHFTGNLRGDYNDYLREPGRPSQGLLPRPRLHLRQKDQPFFEKYIQNVQLDDLFKIDLETLADEAQKHILTNAKVLETRLKEKFASTDATGKATYNTDAIMTFGSFLVQRCYLVAVYTPSQNSAFRVFSVMNSRGLDLLPIDIIKADIIGKIPAAEQTAYTDKWEDLETQTTRSGFNEVFTHTRTIFAKNKAKRALLDEFREFVLAKTTPKELIDDILDPYADAYVTLKNKCYAATKNAAEVNNLLAWLNKIDNSDWMPAAMKFFAEQQDPDYILWYVQKLERLASYLHATSKDINQRIERYSRILVEMDNNPQHSLTDSLKSVELSDAEKVEFLKALDGEIYKMTARRRNYIILRLDSFVSDGAASYDPSVLTIEHILPQTVAIGSEWEEKWPNVSEREFWLNRIANLVPLTRRHNSEAQNYDFDKKKSTYFTGKSGTTSYSLTTQVIQEPVWTPDVVKQRQAVLLDVFKSKWNL